MFNQVKSQSPSLGPVLTRDSVPIGGSFQLALTNTLKPHSPSSVSLLPHFLTLLLLPRDPIPHSRFPQFTTQVNWTAICPLNTGGTAANTGCF